MSQSEAYSKTFESLIHDVQNLVTLHPAEKGTPGRPAGDLQPLLRSVIVLLHTAWENYVEQVALESLEKVLAHIGDDHALLPRALRQDIGATKDPWRLAGNGWQDAARDAVRRQVDRLNTPDVANVDALLNLACGYSSPLSDISWQGAGNAKVRESIDQFVKDVRGEIVHKGATPGALNKSGAESWIAFITNVVTRLDAKLGAFLETTTGVAPW